MRAVAPKQAVTNRAVGADASTGLAETSNPWLLGTRPGSAEATPERPAGPALPSLIGPAQPQPGLVPSDAADRLPRRSSLQSAQLWWVGAHGGAGESTLATLLPGSAAAGRAWPLGQGAERPTAVLVSRTHLAGLMAAQRAAVDWASGGVPDIQLLGLVLVPDAPGRLPRALRDFARVVAGGVPRVWQLPWVDEWRTTTAVDPAQAPGAARRLLKDLSHLLAEQAVALQEGTPS